MRKEIDETADMDHAILADCGSLQQKFKCEFNCSHFEAGLKPVQDRGYRLEGADARATQIQSFARAPDNKMPGIAALVKGTSTKS